MPLVGRLRDALAELDRPFQKPELDRLIEDSRAATGPEPYRRLDAVLNTPFVSPADRPRLCEAAAHLARKLDEGTPGPQSVRGTTVERAAEGADLERLQRALSILELGGAPTAKLRQPLRNITRLDQMTADARLDLGEAVRQAWAGLAAPPGKGVEPRAIERRGRVVPPLRTARALDDPRTNPTAVQFARDLLDFWRWTANRYRYEGQILGDNSHRLRFDEVAASDCGQPVRAAGAELLHDPSLQIKPNGLTPRLSADQPTATVVIRIELVEASRAAQAALSVLPPPDGRLKVVPAAGDAERLRLSPEQYSEPKLLVQWDPGGPRPEGGRLRTPLKGFVVVATLDQRPYPLLVPVSGALGIDPPELLVGLERSDPPVSPLTEIRVRPKMAPQPFYLFVRNSADRERTVRVQVRVGNEDLPGGAAEVKVGPNAIARVPAFAAPKTPPPTSPPPPAGTPWPEFQGPLEIRLSAPDAGQDVPVSLPVRLAEPTEYVEVVEGTFTPTGTAADGKNRLAVELRTLRALPKAPAAVELVLDRIPGLKGDPKVRNLAFKELSQQDQHVTLFAEDLPLDVGVVNQRGQFSLMVDDFPRALTFVANFPRQGPRQPVREDDAPALRLEAAGIALSSEPLPVKALVDNAPPGSTIQLALAPAGGPNAVYIRRQARPDVKERHLGFKLDPQNGALVFEGFVHDWTITFDVGGIRGPHTVWAWLQGPGGDVLATASARVLFDDQPPADVTFVRWRDQAPNKLAELEVAATGRSPSGIKRVNFFLGAPIKNKRPEGARPIPGVLSRDNQTWTAKIPLQGSEVGPIDVSVEFENRVGLSAFDTRTVAFAAPKPVMTEDSAETKKKAGPGTIVGTVTENSIAQSGLSVALYEILDPKPKEPKEPKRAQTDEKGQFTFRDVKPGAYLLYVVDNASQTRAQRRLTVESDKTATAELVLSR